MGRVVVVWLGPLAKVANGLSALLICSRPDTQSDTVECVGGVLLEDECVVDAVWLAGAGANLDIVGKASLEFVSSEPENSEARND